MGFEVAVSLADVAAFGDGAGASVGGLLLGAELVAVSADALEGAGMGDRGPLEPLVGESLHVIELLDATSASVELQLADPVASAYRVFDALRYLRAGSASAPSHLCVGPTLRRLRRFRR